MAGIVITEFMAARAVDSLRLRHDVLHDATLVDDAPRLLREASGCDALIVRNRTQVRGALLAALARCKVVGRLGVGMDNLDMAGCAARGVEVIPATGANARSVAEYVVTAALVLLRGAWLSTAAVAAGAWPRTALTYGREVAGKTLGLVGFGSIGQLTAQLARGLGMAVAACDAMLDADHPAFAATGARSAGLDEVIATSDVISLHVPLAASTRGLIDERRIAAMKPGAVLINTARGGIVDERAVVAALQSGRLGGAALDVFDEEPLPARAHFAHVAAAAGLRNLILAPHIAGLSVEADERVSGMIAERVLRALDALDALDASRAAR